MSISLDLDVNVVSLLRNLSQLGGFLGACLSDKLGEGRLGVVEEVERLIQLNEHALVEDCNSVGIDDGVKTMGDRQDGAARKGLANGLLNQTIRLEVYGGSGLTTV